LELFNRLNASRQDPFTQWIEPDIPILIAAKAEYAKLK